MVNLLKWNLPDSNLSRNQYPLTVLPRSKTGILSTILYILVLKLNENKSVGFHGYHVLPSSFYKMFDKVKHFLWLLPLSPAGSSLSTEH